MLLAIHRGSHQIGGSCVEIATASTRIILDVGLPLDKLGQRSVGPQADPLISAVFAKSPPVSGVLLSHAHADHTGLVRLVPRPVPIYLSQGTSKMIYAGALYAGQPEVPRAQQRELRPGVPKAIGDITVTACPVDHSAFDSQAFLIEADGQRLLYSGDLRLHGRKPGMVRALLNALSNKPVDVLLMEGTHFSADRKPGVTEYELEDVIRFDIKTAPGLVLASFSPMHIDRLVTFYKATLRAGRVFVVDHYGAFVLYLVSHQASLPRAEAAAGIRVFLPQRRIVNPKVEAEVAYDPIKLEEILTRPDGYVMLFRCSMLERDFAGKLPERVRCLYSYWSGYLDQPDWQKARAKVAEAGGDFLQRHTSGHIHAADIVDFVHAINPRHVIPIHTARPEEFRKHFPNARLLRDGEGHDLGK